MSIPGAASPLFLATTAGAADAFEISRSLRFNSGDSAYLLKDFASAGNRRTWTWSGWVKRSKLGSIQVVLMATSHVGTTTAAFFKADDTLEFYDYQSGGYTSRLITSQVFRDTSSWFHLVVSWDTTKSTSSDRAKIYVNGSQITSFGTGTYPNQNIESRWNNNVTHDIGQENDNNYLDAYLAEVNFIDGQALAPTDFGETDTNGVWQAKEFTGTYGWFNNSQTWSTYGSHSGSTSNTTGSGWQSAFDISPTTYTWSAGGSDLTFTSGIPYTSKVEIYGYKFSSSNQIRVNGSAVSGFNIGTSDTSLSWVTALTGSGNLTSIGSTGYGLVARVRVDGKLLIDSGISVADNSFRLPFTDNSTTQALGYDAAVTAPTLNPKGGMDVVTYTGTGSARSIGGLAFQPDFVWIKERGSTGDHHLFDSVRGATKALRSNETDAEVTDANELTAFNSDGFSLGSGGDVNANGTTTVAWAWKAGGAAVSNTDGSITSQVSANNTYGFSIVSYSAADAAVSVGHGLSNAPKMIFTKPRNAAVGWKVYHSGLAGADAASTYAKDYYLTLNGTNMYTYDANYWGSAGSNSTTFGTHASADNALNDMIAYCWSEVAGFSKFGSYSGGTNNNTITLGFKPRYLLIKVTNTSDSWLIYDSERHPGNPVDDFLQANNSEAEATGNSNAINFLADGFQLASTQGGTNGSGNTYIYAAFADRPGNNWTPNNFVVASLGYLASTSASPSGSTGFSSPIANLFDASDSTYATANYSAGDTTDITVTFNPAVTAGSTLTTKIYQYSTYHSLKVNSGSFVVAGGAVVNLLSGHGISAGDSITSITYRTVSPTSSWNLGNQWYYIKNDNINLEISPASEPSEIDSLVDSPSNGTQDDTGVGGEVVGNYCTPNPLNTNSNVGFSDGNLNLNSTAGGWYSCYSTMGISSGKFYWEATAENNSSSALNSLRIGIAPASSNILNSYIGSISDGYGYSQSNGNKYNNGSGSSYGSSLSVGDIVMVAFDADNGKIWWGKNGTWFASGNPASGTNAAFTSIPSNTYVPAFSFDRGRWIVNMGARAFAYTAPSGYKSLNTANLPTPAIADGSKYFDTKLYTGNGSSQTISGLNMSPDFVWIKSRSQGNRAHRLYDIIRGPLNSLASSDTGAEQNIANTLSAFNSDGFSLGSDVSENSSGSTYAAWAWDGGNGNNTYTVTVSGGKFYIDGVQQPTLTLAEGSTYKFDQADSTNNSHPLRFSTTSDGTHGGGSEYTTGVTTAGTPGSAGAFTQIVIAASAPTLYAYCTNHSGMGFQVNTSDKGGYTIPVGGLNSSVYDQSQTWSSAGTYSTSGSIAAESGSISNVFNGNSASGKYINANLPAYAEYVFNSAWSGANTFALIAANGTGSTGGGASDSRFQLLDASNNVLGYVAPNTASSTEYPAVTLSNVAKIRWYDQTAIGLFLYGIKVNGKLLIDSGVSVTNVPSIASQVMASPESGFSIVGYTGDGSAATIGHGLNAAPEMIIKKFRSATSSWDVYHASVGAGKRLVLNATDAEASTSSYQNVNSTTFDVHAGNNDSGVTMLALCFAPVAGYSAMGSYVGNGSTDGPFVALSFRPKFLLMKSAGAGNWVIIDSARDTYNIADGDLYPDETNAEGSNPRLDILSNGFKLRSTYTSTNPSGTSVTYIAFAENPFQANGGLAR